MLPDIIFHFSNTQINFSYKSTQDLFSHYNLSYINRVFNIYCKKWK